MREQAKNEPLEAWIKELGDLAIARARVGDLNFFREEDFSQMMDLVSPRVKESIDSLGYNIGEVVYADIHSTKKTEARNKVISDLFGAIAVPIFDAAEDQNRSKALKVAVCALAAAYQERTKEDEDALDMLNARLEPGIRKGVSIAKNAWSNVNMTVDSRAIQDAVLFVNDPSKNPLI